MCPLDIVSPLEMTSSLALDFLRRTFDAAWVIDEDSEIVLANNAAERLTGYSLDELIGQRFELLLPPHLAPRHADLVRAYFARGDGRSSVLDRAREFTIVDRSGHEIPIELMAFELARVDGRAYLGALMRDIRERRAFEQRQREMIHEMSELARTDELTGLLNRRAFLSRLEEAKGLVKRHKRPVVVALADVDQFKEINDSYGHEAGDRALRSVATVLRSKLRSENAVGRLGGDEFGLLFPEADLGQAQLAAEQVRSAIAETPVVVGDASVRRLTLSIGLAAARPSDEPIQDAMKRADRALYSAKGAGRNRIVVCEEDRALSCAAGS